MRKPFFILIVSLITISHSALAQQRSAKRGIGWDEKTQPLSETTIATMAPGVSWVYNWAVAPASTLTSLGPGGSIEFVPMCWNAAYNETVLRNYLTTLPGVKLLLGFNEPNFSSQSNMTPQQAASTWPRLEQLARDFGLLLAAPALNFTGEYVGGRVWSPYEWLDEFFRLYPAAKVDYLALHCYMNWCSSTIWFATEYFYKDLYDTKKTDVYGRYPHLVSYLDSYRQANGHFPRMYLTEFCAWEGNKDGFTLNADSQIDQMTQKVQQLELSELVAGYAWFIGNASGGSSSYPYMSLFEHNASSSDLPALGKVYVYMSSFDTSKYYAPGETIQAKDYVNASTDSQAPRLRPNTESGSTTPLQVEWRGSSWMAYQVDVPETGSYQLTLHAKSAQANSIRIYRDALSAANKLFDAKLPSTGDAWGDVSLELSLPAGRYSLLLYNMSQNAILLNSLSMGYATAISHVSDKRHPQGRSFLLCGIAASSQNRKGILIRNGKKLHR